MKQRHMSFCCKASTDETCFRQKIRIHMHAGTIHHRQQAERPRHFTRQRRIPCRKQNLCTDMFWLYMRQQIQNLLPDTGSCPAVSRICDFFFKFTKYTRPFFCSFLGNGLAVFLLLLRSSGCRTVRIGCFSELVFL